MTTLTTMFNHLLGWLFALVAILFGIPLDGFDVSGFSPEVLTIADEFVNEFTFFNQNFEPLSPIILLPVAIFVIGAIIGLAHRLIRG